ncbi:aldo/keto reductase [Psychromonas antarctica]|uniref:aldo/keto reductase n=1 Tax=Psychromonas antarctica TaxID=67573 RepID=UPI001EE84ED9|nr:aldo/keto reductase [Psychromonas antarctica]MCG6201704.1 aldo/keto reductase [Psychromonas antarctica]
MKQRKYGKTGKMVSQLGFGAWQLGNCNKSEWGDAQQDPIRLVHAAIDQGINFFDSALNYGQGASMENLGKALINKRADVVLNTKFGHGPDGENFDPNTLKDTVETSLRMLKTDYIDSVILHSPAIELCNGENPLYPIFQELVKEGKILAFGASIDDHNSIDELVRTTPSNIIMPLYNINFQDSGLAFKEAAEKEYGVVVKVPLDSGWLTGKFSRESTFSDIRSRWSTEEIKRRYGLQQALNKIINEEMTLHEAALSFILAQSEVSTVIPGIKNEQQLAANISASKKVMSPELERKLKAYYDTNIKSAPLGW